MIPEEDQKAYAAHQFRKSQGFWSKPIVIALIGLFGSVGGGLFNYMLVDRAKLDMEKSVQATEKAKLLLETTRSRQMLTPDFLKVVESLRPIVKTHCDPIRKRNRIFILTCNFENSGTVKILLTETKYWLKDPIDDTEIPKSEWKLQGIEGAGIPGKGYTSMSIYFTPPKNRNINHLTLIVKFLATTDSQTVSLVKRLAAGALDGVDLTGYTQMPTTVTFNFVNFN